MKVNERAVEEGIEVNLEYFGKVGTFEAVITLLVRFSKE